MEHKVRALEFVCGRRGTLEGKTHGKSAPRFSRRLNLRVTVNDDKPASITFSRRGSTVNVMYGFKGSCGAIVYAARETLRRPRCRSPGWLYALQLAHRWPVGCSLLLWEATHAQDLLPSPLLHYLYSSRRSRTLENGQSAYHSKKLLQGVSTHATRPTRLHSRLRRRPPPPPPPASSAHRGIALLDSIFASATPAPASPP
jgi:hypothetical protein